MWQPFTFGTFIRSAIGGILWQFKMPTGYEFAEVVKDMWLAVGDPWEETSCVTVNTCYDRNCSKPAPDVPVT